MFFENRAGGVTQTAEKTITLRETRLGGRMAGPGISSRSRTMLAEIRRFRSRFLDSRKIGLQNALGSSSLIDLIV